MGINTLPSAGRKKVAFQRFNNYRKPNFWSWRDKKIICKFSDFNKS